MSENLGNQEHREIVRSPFRADEEQPYIFISYSHRDRERVFPIIKRLYEQGWKIWYDEGLEIAANYLVTLSQHIKSCAAFLLFVTQNSVKSEFVCQNELTLASNNKRTIVQCLLDENAAFTGEAGDIIDIVTASGKHPVTDEAGLETTLESIDGLERGEPRTAQEITVSSNRQVVTADEEGEYEWVACEGGVCLTRYRGNDEEVRVPSEYPAGSGQTVVELRGTFGIKKEVRKVWLPGSVRKISTATLSFMTLGTFTTCFNLSDVYIPSSVEEIAPESFRWLKGITIHCAEGSAAHAFAQENNLPAELDESLRVSAADRKAGEKPYVYCSYFPAQKDRVAEIMEKLTEAGCEVLDGGSVKESEKLKAMRRSRCFAAFVSKDYIDSDCIEELRYASDTGSNLMIYVLEECTLPHEIEIKHPADQRLHYNSQIEEEHIAKLAEWLGRNGCRRDTGVPGFEYSATKDGITLTGYTGSGGEVVIEREYGGIPVIRIAPEAFKECNSVTAVTIPDTITKITTSMFKSCSGLTSVSIPESVTAIGERAFSGCSRLTSVTVPASVADIGIKVFDGCNNLSAINADKANSHYCSVDGVLLSKEKTTLVVYPQKHGDSYEIPDSVTTIAHDAFSGCSGLASVSIPNSVAAIGEGAFKDCSGLASVTIPDSISAIGDAVFSGCSGLTSVSIPDSVTAIGERAFSGCSGLVSVSIPNSVTAIGEGAFKGCSGLTSVSIPKSVAAIGNSAFFDCSGLTSVTIPDSVTAIGEAAFMGCSGLTSVSIPKSVTAIGDSAFQYCSGLTSVAIPDSVTAIGRAALYGCSGLTSVTIPDSVASIGINAFFFCSELVSVAIPDSVTSIGDTAFAGCNGLTSVTIPDSVTVIGKKAFAGCPNLTVYCSKSSYAWTYCEENNIPHKELTGTPEPAPAEPCVAEPVPAGEPVSESAAEPVAQSAAEPAPTPAESPARRSSAWWLIPAALALVLGGAAAVQLTGLFDILGAIGSLFG